MTYDLYVQYLRYIYRLQLKSSWGYWHMLIFHLIVILTNLNFCFVNIFGHISFDF